VASSAPLQLTILAHNLDMGADDQQADGPALLRSDDNDGGAGVGSCDKSWIRGGGMGAREPDEGCRQENELSQGRHSEDID
jgi:hypothetical protein